MPAKEDQINEELRMAQNIPKGEFLVYQTDSGDIKLEVRLENETIWLTQQMMAELFQCSTDNISLHLKNIYADGELVEISTSEDFSVVRQEGNRKINRKIKHYNLDAIISVGYRVKSLIATQFRIWATKTLKEYIIKGFVMDDERLKNPPVKNSTVPDYFDEMLARIRDIRSSERRMYLRVREIISMAIDYEPNWKETTIVYSIIQNKLHFAATGMTAAELKKSRANAALPFMGLTSWQRDEIRKTDVTIGKNYLNENEIDELNRIVSMLLDFLEDQAKRRKQLFMNQWESKIDEFLKFIERDILNNSGTISREKADNYAKNEYDKYSIKRREEKELTGINDYLNLLENHIDLRNMQK